MPDHGSVPTACDQPPRPQALVQGEPQALSRSGTDVNPSPLLGSRHACVMVSAVHGAGLLGRLTALVGPFPVTSFSYHPEPDRAHVRVDVCLSGDEWQIERVANKLRRVIGVLKVETDPRDSHV